MTRLLTNEIATMTEMREPQKVLDRAKGRPVAVLKNSKVVAYLVPEEAISEQGSMRELSMDDVMDAINRRRSVNQPVLDYLKDK